MLKQLGFYLNKKKYIIAKLLSCYYVKQKSIYIYY